MLLDGALWVLFGLGVAGLVGLIVRKLPVVKAIDIAQVRELKLKEVKRDLVESRLRRTLTGWFTAAAARLQPATGVVRRPFRTFTQRVRDFEVYARRELVRRAEPARTPLQLVTEGRAALEAGHTAEAERLFLEALRQNARELKAYEGLGELYLRERDYEQAGEVFNFLIERNRGAASYLGAARVAAGQGNLPAAVVAYAKALEVEDSVAPRLEFARVLTEVGESLAALEQVLAARQLEPMNPKILDFCIELSIVNGRPLEAQSALDALRTVNPDNQKIPELALAVRKLAQQLKPKPAPGRKAESFGVTIRGAAKH